MIKIDKLIKLTIGVVLFLTITGIAFGQTTATTFSIVAPATVRINTAFEVIVKAVDGSDATDVSPRQVTLSHSGTGTLTPASALIAVDMTAGVQTWSDLQYDAVGTLTVTVTDNTGSLSSITKDIEFTAPPIFTVTATTLTGFGEVNNGDNSPSQSFTVEGTGLTANITVTAPTGFQVSLDDSDFSGPVDLTPDTATGILGSTTVHVRFAPRSEINGEVTVDIELSTAGADAQTVEVTGTEAGNAPVIGVIGTLSDFGSVNDGETSTAQSFAAVGANFSSNITVTAPTGFEVSLDNTTFTTVVELEPTSGTLASTTVHVRFAPTIPAFGRVTESIVLSATGASSVSVPATGTAVIPSSVTGIDQESLKYNISVYPNPSEEVLHITIPESFGTGEVKLVSLDGAVVQKGSIGRMKQIETSNLRSGIYLLQILNATTVANYRVVVK